MAFSDIITADLGAIMNMKETSIDIIYNSVQITVIARFTTEAEKQTGLIISDAVLVVKKSDVSKPSTRDNATINGDDYRIGQILEEDSHTWSIEANKMSVYL